MKDLPDIRSFIEGKYEVVVIVTDDGCVAHYPDRKQYPESLPFINEYTISEDNNGIEYKRITPDGKILKDVFVNLPTYAIRSYILCDLIKFCLMIKYNYGLIKFIHEGASISQENFFFLLNQPFANEDHESMKKEEDLKRVVFDAYEDGFNHSHEHADNAGIGEGFRLICGNFLEVMS